MPKFALLAVTYDGETSAISNAEQCLTQDRAGTSAHLPAAVTVFWLYGTGTPNRVVTEEIGDAAAHAGAA